MRLALIQCIAEEVLEHLAPHCERIAIAGSIRRQKDEVKDIEIVAVPKAYQINLFEDGLAKAVSGWDLIKGPMEYGVRKYSQFLLPEQVKLDLFMPELGNWGWCMTYRTGSSEFNAYRLLPALKRNGYVMQGGWVTYQDERIYTPEEKDVFVRAGLEWVEPHLRQGFGE